MPQTIPSPHPNGHNDQVGSITVGGQLIAPVSKQVAAALERNPLPGIRGAWPAEMLGRSDQLLAITDDALVVLTNEGRTVLPWNAITAIEQRMIVADGQGIPFRVNSHNAATFWPAAAEHLPFAVPSEPAPAPTVENPPAAQPHPTPPAKFCGQCGAPLTPDLRFCGQCGQPVPAVATSASAPQPLPPEATAADAPTRRPLHPIAAPVTGKPNSDHGSGLKLFVAAVIIGALAWFGVVMFKTAQDQGVITASRSEAYKRGEQIGQQYDAFANQAEVTDTWTGSTDAPALREGLDAWCAVEWQGQGIQVGGLANTPENKKDFIQGCKDAINKGQ